MSSMKFGKRCTVSDANQLQEPNEEHVKYDDDEIDEVLGKVLKFPKDKMH